MDGDSAREQRYQALFQSIDQAFAIVEVLLDDAGVPVDYRFLETNPVYLRHTALVDVVGKTGRELVPKLEPFWVETFGRVALTGEAERFTSPVVGMDRWFECYAFRFGAPEERQVAVFFNDATARLVTEQRDRFLVALDDATRSLVEPLEIATAAARLLGERLRVDRVAYLEVDEDEDGVELLGEWAPDRPSMVGRYRLGDYGEAFRTALRRGAHVLLQNADDGALGAAERERYAALQIAAMAVVPLHKGGKLRSALAVYQATPRRWREEETDLVRFVANRCWEAIERARVAERLRDSEEQFRTLASLLPQFLWTARPDGNIYWFNDYAHEFFGRGTEIEGLGWMRFHDPQLLPEIQRGYLEAVAAGSPYSCTTRFRGADGEYRWFIARMLPQHDEDGRVLRFIGYNIDVTDLYETQAQLVEADRRKDEFLATLGHELRNPLAPLYNMLEILKLDPSQEITRDLREMMHRQVHHLGHLVNDLLDASRITRGVVELQRERLSMRDVLDAALETSRPLIEAGRHHLRVEGPRQPLWVHADSVRLTQVLANVLNNAAKYTDREGHIDVRLSSADGHAVVTVKDDGIGIAADMIGQVFDLFTQVDRHSGRAQGGLGVGLSLSRSLIEMHGGSIEARSDGIGRGSTFVIGVPLDASLAATAEPALMPARGSQKGSKLLVVDDNVDAAESLGFVLRSLGGEVEVVYDGASALDRLDQERFAVAFVDLGMPVLDGLEVARRIRGQERFDDVLLVAVTGWDQPEDRARSRTAGFDRHLVKPAEVAELQLVLDSLSDTARAASS